MTPEQLAAGRQPPAERPARRMVFAVGDVPDGALVLVRGIRATVADQSVANAVAAARRPSWRDDADLIRDGQSFTVEMIQGLGARDLQAIADGPIMDGNALYLPAGKLSMAETVAREADQIVEVRQILEREGRG